MWAGGKPDYYGEAWQLQHREALSLAPVCQAWEYLTIGLTGGEKLNDYGKEGWELVAVTSPSEDYFATAYFKRPMGYVVKAGASDGAT